jgi:probable F420-dependent oxidoreductase
MNTRRATLSLFIPNFGSYLRPTGWDGLLDVARSADECDIDRIVLADHVVMGEKTDDYAWGPFPLPPEAPWLEPLTVLAAMAAITSHVRLGTSILIAPLRSATLLAKTAATLDVLSHGRLDLGLGTGWQAAEYEAAGLSFEARGQLFTDAIGACKVLWRDLPARFEKPGLSFTGIYCAPLPEQHGGPPLWIGGSLHARNVRRIVEYGDGWIPIPINGDSTSNIAGTISEGRERLHAALVAGGREPSHMQIRAPLPLVRGENGRFDLQASISTVPALVTAGATDIAVPLHAFCRETKRVPAFLSELRQSFSEAVSF